MVTGPEPEQVEEGRVLHLRHRGEPTEFPGVLHEGEVPSDEGEEAGGELHSVLPFFLGAVFCHDPLWSRETRRRGTSLKRKLLITKTEIAGDKYIYTMTLRQHTEAGKHRAFKGETKLDNY